MNGFGNEIKSAVVSDETVVNMYGFISKSNSNMILNLKITALANEVQLVMILLAIIITLVAFVVIGKCFKDLKWDKQNCGSQERNSITIPNENSLKKIDHNSFCIDASEYNATMAVINNIQYLESKSLVSVSNNDCKSKLKNNIIII